MADGAKDGRRSTGVRVPFSRLLLGLAILLLLGALVASAYYLGYFQPGPSQDGSGLMQATCKTAANSTSGTVQHEASGGSGGHAYFLIVESDPPSPYAGMNGSYYVPATTQWPVMNVTLGQVVSIHVINCASSEPHGFQVQYYDDNSVVAVQPGQSYDVTFTASRAGTFRVYCDIPCAIHPLMINGVLVVS